MTLYDYKLLPLVKQHEVLHTEGDFLEMAHQNELKYMLYSLDSFYVELVYNVPENRIVKLTSFKPCKKLDKYMWNYPSSI